MAKPLASKRARWMKAIHVGVRALGWDDEAYRSFLVQVTGQSSAKDCTDAQLADVLDAMRLRGFKRVDGTTAPIAHASPDNPAAAQLAKIQTLWAQLGDGGVLHDRSETALRSFGHRVTGAAAPEFMTVAQRIKLIEALKAWHAREFADAVRPSTAARPIE